MDLESNLRQLSLWTKTKSINIRRPKLSLKFGKAEMKTPKPMWSLTKNQENTCTHISNKFHTHMTMMSKWKQLKGFQLGRVKKSNFRVLTNKSFGMHTKIHLSIVYRTMIYTFRGHGIVKFWERNIPIWFMNFLSVMKILESRVIRNALVCRK